MERTKSPNRGRRKGGSEAGVSTASEDAQDIWNCGACTYKNKGESFKCQMCDTSRGTSTRKPRTNPHISEQVHAFKRPAKANQATGENKVKKIKNKPKKSAKRNNPPRLKNIDRSTGESSEITVNNVTVVFTEYKPKKKTSTDPAKNSTEPSSPSSSSKNDLKV